MRDSIVGAGIGVAAIAYVAFVSNDPIADDANRVAIAVLDIGLAAGGILVIWRALLAGVKVGPEFVVIHNLLRTRRIELAKVKRFAVGRLRFIDRDAVVVEHADGDPVIVSVLSLSPLDQMRGSNRVVNFVEQLNRALLTGPNGA